LVKGKIVLAVIFLIIENRHSLLALPKFTKALSILPHEAKELLGLFCHWTN